MATVKQMNKWLRLLVRAGWESDEYKAWFNPLTGRSLTLSRLNKAECVHHIEATVHEIAHSRILGLKEMRKPKDTTTTDKLARERPNPCKDEVITTAVTIRVCASLGVDVSEEALQSVKGNAPTIFDARGEVDNCLYQKLVTRYADDVANYVRSFG